MFYVAKILEALGLVVIGVNFLLAFPELMNMKALLAGIILFACGWLVERFLMKSR